MTRSTAVALLRGINVGGKHRLPMSELRQIFEAVGCESVRTYIQSGNVVFSARKALLAKVSQRVEEAIEERFGFRAPVVIRSAAEVAAVARNNPFLDDGEEERALHVMFLADRPKASAVASLDPNLSPPDRFVVQASEIYLHCPNGVARSKLTTSYFDRKLSTTGTLRNWRTVLALLELSKETS